MDDSGVQIHFGAAVDNDPAGLDALTNCGSQRNDDENRDHQSDSNSRIESTPGENPLNSGLRVPHKSIEGLGEYSLDPFCIGSM
jgi:hypothetical protein